MVSEHSRAACCRVVDGPKQWWYGFGSGLSGLFSPRLIGKVSGVLSVAPTALSAAVADGAERASIVRAAAHSRAVCRCVVDGSKQWWYGFGSDEGSLGGLFSPRSFGKVSGLRSAATDCAISCCG